MSARFEMLRRITIPLTAAYYSPESTIYQITLGDECSAANNIFLPAEPEGEVQCMAADKKARRTARLVLGTPNEHGIVKAVGVSVERCSNLAVPPTTDEQIHQFCEEHMPGGPRHEKAISVSTRRLMEQTSLIMTGVRHSSTRVIRLRLRRVAEGNWAASRFYTHDLPLFMRPRQQRRQMRLAQAAQNPAPELEAGGEDVPFFAQTYVDVRQNAPPAFGAQVSEPSMYVLLCWLVVKLDEMRSEIERLAARQPPATVNVGGAILLEDTIEGRVRLQLCGCCETVPANAVAVACGHLYACVLCVRDLEGRCPMCRSETEFIELRCNRIS